MRRFLCAAAVVFGLAGSVLSQEAPEGVGSFVAGGKTFTWDHREPVNGGYTDGWDDGTGNWVCAYVDSSGATGWLYWDSSSGVNVPLTGVGAGQAPMRAAEWSGSLGMPVSSVYDLEGNAWVDPSTGRGWVPASQQTGGGGSGGSGSFVLPSMGVDWSGSVGVVLGMMGAIVIGCLALWAGVRVVRAAKGWLGGVVGGGGGVRDSYSYARQLTGAGYVRAGSMVYDRAQDEEMRGDYGMGLAEFKASGDRAAAEWHAEQRIISEWEEIV